MQTTIQKWGNSLGIRIPKNMASRLNLENGSSVKIEALGNNIIIISEQSELDILVNQITDENKHELLSNDDKIGNESW